MKKTYDLPFSTWITIGLSKDKLNRTLDLIYNNKSLPSDITAPSKNRAYIDKIMREEVFKQFSEFQRPGLEAVLNSLDSVVGLKDANKEVDITVDNSFFKTVDSGKGMSLEDVMKYLIIPFSTEKNGIEEIGRYGVGFMSTLSYCNYDPKLGVVEVISKKKDNKKVAIKIYATSKSVSDIYMKIKILADRNETTGTSVMARSRFDKKTFISYLQSNINNIPEYIGKIFINKKRVNTFDNKWYFRDVSLQIKDKNIVQPLGVRLSDNHYSYLTSSGVKVKTVYNSLSTTGLVVSMPKAINLVEGRDEFKIDDAYRTCLPLLFDCMYDLIEDTKKEKKSNNKSLDIADLLDSLNSLIGSLQVKADLPEVVKVLDSVVEGKKYFVYGTLENSNILNFVSEIKDSTLIAIHRIKMPHTLKGYDAIVKDYLTPSMTLKVSNIRPKVISGELNPNLAIYSMFNYEKVINNYALVQLNSDSGEPHYYDSDNRTMYINTNHNVFKKKLNMTSMFLLQSYLARDNFVSENNRELINKAYDLMEDICTYEKEKKDQAAISLNPSYVMNNKNNQSNQSIDLTNIVNGVSVASNSVTSDATIIKQLNEVLRC